MSQSLYPGSELQLQVYTDDPCAAIRGTASRCRHIVVVLLLVLCLIGYSLATRAAQSGPEEVSWTGYAFAIADARLTVAINES